MIVCNVWKYGVENGTNRNHDLQATFLIDFGVRHGPIYVAYRVTGLLKAKSKHYESVSPLQRQTNRRIDRNNRQNIIFLVFRLFRLKIEQ